MDFNNWRSLRGCHAVAVMLAAASCREATNPDGADGNGTMLAPVSPTQLTGTVGLALIDAPSVIVRDSRGRGVAGVTVTFSVRSGHGVISNPRGVSNSSGIASAGEWTLGTVPGTNAIAATNASGDTVVFTAEAVAGPPSHVEKLDGDDQVGAPGATLGGHPRVRVSDEQRNPLSGVAVTFTVEAGGGSVSGAVAVTDSAGIAESGVWVLGQLGVQRLVARAAGLASQPFTARALLPGPSCPPSGWLTIGTMTQAELTATSCAGSDGGAVDVYTIVVTESNAYDFTATSGAFDTYLELRGAGLIEVARNENSSETATNSEIKALLIPGTYTLLVSSSMAGVGGSYSVGYRAVSVSADRCEDVFVVRGVTVRGVADQFDCQPSPNEYLDRYRIYLEAGARVTIQVKDFSYSGPSIEVVGPDESSASAFAGDNYLTTLVFVAPVDGYYAVLVGLLDDTDIDYELSIQ